MKWQRLICNAYTWYIDKTKTLNAMEQEIFQIHIVLFRFGYQNFLSLLLVVVICVINACHCAHCAHKLSQYPFISLKSMYTLNLTVYRIKYKKTISYWVRWFFLNKFDFYFVFTQIGRAFVEVKTDKLSFMLNISKL